MIFLHFCVLYSSVSVKRSFLTNPHVEMYIRNTMIWEKLFSLVITYVQKKLLLEHGIHQFYKAKRTAQSYKKAVCVCVCVCVIKWINYKIRVRYLCLLCIFWTTSCHQYWSSHLWKGTKPGRIFVICIFITDSQ